MGHHDIDFIVTSIADQIQALERRTAPVLHALRREVNNKLSTGGNEPSAASDPERGELTTSMGKALSLDTRSS